MRYINLKFISVVFMLLVFCSSVALAQDDSSELPTNLVEYIVTAETVNLRSGPGTSNEIAGTASEGDVLLIYVEEPEVNGWLRIYRENDEDAYIADFLVERAPQRFYPITQEPILSVTGQGSNITEVFDIPRGAYRVDVTVNDNFFILSSIVIEGDCRDTNVLNEGVRGVNSLSISGLFVSQGCSIIFETDNVDGSWEIELRDILDPDIIIDNTLTIEDSVTISGTGRQVTMPTLVSEGIWTISAEVNDNFFILRAEPIGDCDDGAVINEGNTNTSSLAVSTIYRANEDCVVYWQTSNVDDDWTITFERLR